MTPFILRLRFSWIVGALCVLACASFAARALGHVIEARYLAESTAAAAPPAVVAAPPPAAPPRGGQASTLVDRNPFCSDCTTGPDDPLSAVTTSHLPVVLVATSLAPEAADSYATLRNLETGAQGAFWIGHAVPGIGVLERVAGTFVWLRTEGGLERVDLLAIATATAPAPAPGKAARTADEPAWRERIRKVDDATYEVDRELVRELVGAGAQAKVPGVRLMPAAGKDGKLRGVKVSQARKGSLAAELGLRTGDVIEAIDGKALDSTSVFLEAYGDLERASSARVSISRGGKPSEIEYRLR